MSKYKAKKTIADGITFDSKKEALYYLKLKKIEAEGEIAELKLQPRFVLVPSFKKNGKTYRQLAYIADFSYRTTADSKMHVVDVKGFKTDVYKLKKKIFEYTYKEMEIEEI